jgi:hypothetical protein
VTEAKALVLICAATVLLTALFIFGLGALGARQLGIALGAIVPLVFAADGITRVVMHYGESNRRRR